MADIEKRLKRLLELTAKPLKPSKLIADNAAAVVHSHSTKDEEIMARLNSLKIPTEPASTPTPNNNIEDRFEQLTGRKPYTSTSDGAISNFTQKPAPEETPDDILKRVNLELSLEQQTRQLQQEADQALKDRLERMTRFKNGGPTRGRKRVKRMGMNSGKILKLGRQKKPRRGRDYTRL